MCGIAGFIGNKNNMPSLKQIKNCKNSLEKRGPDANGFYKIDSKKKAILFVHTRLSIVDLNLEASQPFSDHNGTLIFNGMIYNYIELRKLLRKKGEKFKTSSDTEVLLKMLNIYKEKAFEMLDGMWVLAYYNFKKNEVILSRDRFGEKPLFYQIINNNFFFSNSIKALNKLSGKKLKFNDSKVKKFLCYPDKSYGLDKETFFEKIFQFPNSSYLKLNLDNLNMSTKFKKYWNLSIKENNKPFNYVCKEVKKKLKYVIKTRTRSDVLNSVLVSGGLDSNTIVSEASKLSNINGYSLVSTNPNYDERKQIKSSELLNKFKTNLISSKNSKSLSLLEKIVQYGYNPLITPTALALALLCSKIKRDNNKVLLTGIGGDELFCGYYVNYLSHILSFENKQEYFEKYSFWKNEIKKFIRNENLKNFKIAKKLKNKYRLNFFIEGNSIIKNYFKNYNEIKIKKLHKDVFYNNMLQNIFFQSIPSQVCQSDYVCMYFSIENRSPFLSHDLFEYIFKTNKNFFMYKGVPKAILRNSMKNSFPKEIFNNFEKTGFYSPFNSFFGTKDIKKIRKYLLNSKCLRNNLKMNSLKKLLSGSQMLHQESKFIFACLNIAILEKAIK